MECPVCREVAAETYALVPCGHVFCKSCANRLESAEKCAMCNAVSHVSMKVYIGIMPDATQMVALYDRVKDGNLSALIEYPHVSKMMTLGMTKWTDSLTAFLVMSRDAFDDFDEYAQEIRKVLVKPPGKTTDGYRKKWVKEGLCLGAHWLNDTRVWDILLEYQTADSLLAEVITAVKKNCMMGSIDVTSCKHLVRRGARDFDAALALLEDVCEADETRAFLLRAKYVARDAVAKALENL